MAQDRDLSNVVVVVVEDGLSQHLSSFFPAALISKPPDPDPNTSVSGTQRHVTGPGSGLGQGERMIVMQQIDQVSQDTAKLSICRTVHIGQCVCFLHKAGSGLVLCVWGSEYKNQ